MALSTPSLGLICLLFFLLAHPAHAFGAGNIASLARIEGQNWRHGDVEDTLLTLFMARVAGGHKFSKLDVKRVYFGNWLRDYSQAVDVGTVKYVSAEAIRILLWVLGFMSFGYGTNEFEVTTDRLGCYEPTEHIDNPLGYAEGEDARRYDRRLRGPVDEERELSIDPRTGLKNYIASEDIGINSSAGLVRRVLGESVELGRRYARSRDDADLYEALRLMGTGLHCLEDYAAHSNYTELSLIELGERDVFPHVGRRTQIELRGARHPVYPIVTGTFGGVDFLHSVMGEFTDKATQSEIQSLEGAIADSQNGTPGENFLQNLLNKVPDGILGGGDQAGKMDEFKMKAEDAKAKSQNITPREPEEWTRYLDDAQRQIYPVLQWHDELLKTINEAIENIPVLPELIEQIQDQLTIFVFSILAPYVLPIIQQVKTELETGSSEVIQSSMEKQHVVFNDDSCSNPTHSMLSKDHFSNVLNEPAGRIASQVVRWTVPQLMACWDDENIDLDRMLNRIIYGVFHHPALRDYAEDGASDIRQLMFRTVEEWWSEKGEEGQDIMRRQLSREGVRNGQNHKEGVHDTGHGCGKPLGLPKRSGSCSKGSAPDTNTIGKIAEEAVGGGVLGGLISGIVGGVGSQLLGGALGGDSGEKNRKRDRYKHDGSYDQPHGDSGNYPQQAYGNQQGHEQAEYVRTDAYGGGKRDEYRQAEQARYDGESGYAYQESRGSYSSTARPDKRQQRAGYGGDSEYAYQESRESYRSDQRYENGVDRSQESASAWQLEADRRFEEAPRRDGYGTSQRRESEYDGGSIYGRGATGYGQSIDRGYGSQSHYIARQEMEEGYGHEQESRQYSFGAEVDERRYGSDNDSDGEKTYRRRYEGGRDDDDHGRHQHQHHHHRHHHHRSGSEHSDD